MPEKILQCGYMSGDMFTTAVYLKLNPTAKVMLVKDDKEPQDKTDAVVAKFYGECGLTAQVKKIDISASKLHAKDLWYATSEKYKANDPAPAAYTAPTRADQVTATTELLRVQNLLYSETTRGWPRAITAVTGLVANAWHANPVRTGNAIATMWRTTGIPVEMRDALADYMVRKFTKMDFRFRKNVLVLWSRQSGKRGGAHIELDSSYEGIRQIARKFAIEKGTATVLLAGDESKAGGKLARLATESTHIIDVSNMWKDEAWTREPLKSSPYLGQFTFFKEVMGEANIVHIGMRSGVLESMALLGMKTLYLEPDVCPSGSRMLAFGASGINYFRVNITAPSGLKAWTAQRSIENDGVKAPSLAFQDQKIDNTAKALMRNPEYTKWYENKSGHINKAAAQLDSRIYAKAHVVLGKPIPDLIAMTPAEVRQLMSDTRGFYDTDLATIVRAVEARFVR